MRPALLRAAAIALGVPLLAAAPADPLAPARTGELQCYKPDTRHKTCDALAAYIFDADGTIRNPSENLLLPNPLVTMKSITSVYVKDGAVCGPLRKEDFDSASIYLNGQPLSDDKSDKVREDVEKSLAGKLGKEACTTYVPQADGMLTARVTLDGVDAPELSVPVIWVKPADGYTVGAPPPPAPAPDRR